MTVFNVKAQVPPRQQREQIILKKTNIFFPVFPIAAVRTDLEPVSFLNSLERKLGNIAFPLSSVLFVKANNAKNSYQLLLLFCGGFEGLVCKPAVEHQIRYTKRVDLPTDVAVRVVSLVLGGVVHPW